MIKKNNWRGYSSLIPSDNEIKFQKLIRKTNQNAKRDTKKGDTN